ncbi:MAG: cardiolipin synthase [Planctomycetales bacterium]|nr:cardiolipin synthase [Planctomycetales bacterium]
MSAISDFFANHALGAWITVAAIVIHLAIQLTLAVKLILQRRSTGESLAWLMVIFAFPAGGPLLFFVVGESRLGRRRAQRFIQLQPPVKRWLAQIPDRSQVDWSRIEEKYEPIAQMSLRTIGVPALGCNRLELLPDWQHVFAGLIADIEAARETCHLEFYIWNNGGEADRVVDALVRAAGRGVTCRILVDSLGSHKFHRSEQADRLRAAGVLVRDALPGGLLRMPFVRIDLRLHRKIVVIDGAIAYTGSLNLVDPRYFKRDAGVGQWVDAMVRVEGPAVEALAITFLADWYVESEDTLEQLQETGGASSQPCRGEAAVQVLPSGPDLPPHAVEHVLMTAIYSARREIVLTTPYFVPSEPLTMALVAAARRGVKVILVAPKKVDSLLVRFASGAFKGELLEAGVRIALFHDGLLHTKSVTVDGSYALFGSVNLDPRSFRLNFEILLAVYDPPFTRELRALQQQYIDGSELMDLAAYRDRPALQHGVESFARLFGPLL